MDCMAVILSVGILYSLLLVDIPNIGWPSKLTQNMLVPILFFFLFALLELTEENGFYNLLIFRLGTL